MKKFLRLLFIPLVVSLVSCIDRDYDLSKVETDDITIGGDGSVFQFPLATVKISLKELALNGIDIQHLFAEADTWLPTQLPDTDAKGAYIDVVKINANDATYITALLDALTSEMLANDTKCNAAASCIYANSDYKTTFNKYLPPNLNTEAEFVEAFRSTFRVNPLLRAELRTLANDYLTSNLKVELKPYVIEGVSIDSDIVNMLASNLDRPGNSLKIYGSTTSALPISLILASPQLSNTAIDFGNIEVEAAATSKISPTTITEADLRQIIDHVEISLPVVLTRYYPAAGFKQQDEQLTLKLILEKRGGLKL